MERQRKELDEAINELKAQLAWGQSLLQKKAQEPVTTQI
jgi:hypothetical protein